MKNNKTQNNKNKNYNITYIKKNTKIKRNYGKPTCSKSTPQKI